MAGLTRTASNLRPTLNHSQSQAPNQSISPQTPTRAFSSTFSSPGSSLRSDDEQIILEFGARYLRGGVAGENEPRCILDYGPDTQRRQGDYRQWEQGYEESWRKRRRGNRFGESHELWSMDVRSMDLALFEDQIERAIREAITKYHIGDSKPHRMLLALPPHLPHPLLSTIFTTLFIQFQAPSIAIMSTPTLSAIAAGVRNALVVDIGWHETVATAVYEYREVQHTRTIKGAKALLQETGKLLVRNIRKAREWHEADGTEDSADDFAEDISLEECEEVLTRLVWCRSRREALIAREGDNLSATSAELSHQFRSMHIAEDATAGSVSLSLLNQPMSITLNSTRPPTVIQVPFFSLSSPTEMALFPCADDADDNELPVDLLVYQALRALPVDIRGLCMSRIVISGGVSRLPGIKWRIIEEVKALFDVYGWEKVRGRAADACRQRLRERSQNSQVKHQAPNSGSFTKVSAAFEDQQRDPVEESLHRHDAKQGPKGVIRGIETLGPWTGASLLAGMKAKSVVQIEKEKYMQNGLAGASKEGEVTVAPQRMSVGPSGPRQGLASQSNWTLAGWA